MPRSRDPLHDLQLLRDLSIINARTTAELGPLPPGGVPVAPKRKPNLPRPRSSTQTQEPAMAIDPIKLKAAAEHLEWVLNQYPDSEDVQGLLQALMPLIEDAKAGKVMGPVDSKDIPGGYNFGAGLYVPYKNPSVGDAYAKFIIEMEGGLTEQDKRRLAEMEAYRKKLLETKP